MANCHTIIGAKRFHFRVRDGIGWFTLAMVTKQTGVKGRYKVKGSRRKAYYSLSAWSLYVALYPVFLGVSLPASASQLFPGKCRFRLFSFAFGLLPAFWKSVIVGSLASKRQLSGQVASFRLFSPWAFYLAPASPKLIGCYMVKPHGQLVHVSCTHYCASTSCLSTS